MRPNNGLIFQVIKTSPAALGVPALAKTTLIHLLDYWNPNKSGAVVYPGVERLAEQTGMSEKTVRRTIKDLESVDLVKTTRRPNSSNRYQIEVALIGRLCEMARQDGPVSVTGPDSGPVSLTTRSGLSDHPVRSERPVNALQNALDNSLRRSTCDSANPEQRKMPLVGEVVRNALSREKAEGA